ncbi:cyclopropane-fatty-acyl-phospholipid synthase family protein [Burkholderia sp. Ac-20392]|uniref:SAM-dependent methyltransferase n=1 Tax=Burkholderia sp. Ac-20392 TaxID=2703905 RepID=UPI001F11F5E8|nr:cyclopropane-fatty-acyl-phospholipid synthase family protein [Burkholderia sp. Ac-20392]
MTLLHLLSCASQPAMPLSPRLFVALLRRLRHGHLTLVTPDGAQHVFGDPHRQPAATLQIHDWRACRAILRAGDIGFAEAYRACRVDTPDLVTLLRLAIRNEPAIAQTLTGGRLARVWYALRHRLRMNTRAGSRRNIHAHYDLGNRFYGLWLDDTWTYSSACFDGDEQRPLADAQAAKYQRIVESLGLRAGMHVLEIGCGWGGFAMHAARQGIRVHALTISRAQYVLAVERIARAGLSDLVTVELRDYRDIDGQYDAIVSIEMFEAVGEAFWPVYFDTLRQRLKVGARALIQSITIDDSQFEAYRASSDFIREFIFPGGMLPSPGRFIEAARRAGLAAEPVLAFGLDYARTLQTWRAAFEARLDAVRAQGFDEIFIRTWRLYLTYCEAAFVERRTDVMHFVVSAGDRRDAQALDPRGHGGIRRDAGGQSGLC